MNAKIPGSVKQGRFIPADPLKFKLAFCAHEGKQVVVTVSRKTKSRSNNQNAYMFGVVLPLLSEVTGYTPDEAKSAIQWLFLRVRMDGLPDTVKGTSKLSTAEFEAFMTEVRQWASIELNCYIPLPSEVEF